METYKVKISSKGQITLPKKVRENLGAIILEIIITDNQVVVKPVESVKSLAGSLKRYTKNVSKKLSIVLLFTSIFFKIGQESRVWRKS